MRLTPAQKSMLREIAEAGTLYIKRYSRWDRTAGALSNKGLIRVTELGYPRVGQDGYSLTDKGCEYMREVTG